MFDIFTYWMCPGSLYELFYVPDFTKTYMDMEFQTSGLFIRGSQRSDSVKEFYLIYLLYSLLDPLTFNKEQF